MKGRNAKSRRAGTAAGFRQSPQPSLTVGLLNRPRLKSVARASARAVAQRNNLWDFDGALGTAASKVPLSKEAQRIRRNRASLAEGQSFVPLGKGDYRGCAWNKEDPLPRKTRRSFLKASIPLQKGGTNVETPDAVSQKPRGGCVTRRKARSGRPREVALFELALR
jgi:hypothetical protein